MTAAITSNRWIKLPPTPPTNPNSQSTTSTAKIVHNIVLSSFELKLVSGYLEPCRELQSLATARALTKCKECAMGGYALFAGL
jgi:hypothetical protein